MRLVVTLRSSVMSHRGMPAALALAVLCAGAAGCAAARQVTWDDVEAAGAIPVAYSRSAGDAHAVQAERAEGGESSAASAGIADALHAGPRIDAALRAFTHARAQLHDAPPTSGAFAAAWEEALSEISAAALLQPRARDLGAFVRARVTLEVELDSDQRRGVLLPDDLDARVRSALLLVDESVGELRAANAPGTSQQMPRPEGEVALRPPVYPFIVTSRFGVRTDPINGQRRFHAGVDLDGAVGIPVFAAAPGLVVYAGLQGGYGRQIVLDHGNGMRTHYAHLSSIEVKIGEVVDVGDTIGLVGNSGRSTGPHLHFAVTDEDGEFQDPQKLLDSPFADGPAVAQMTSMARGHRPHRGVR